MKKLSVICIFALVLDFIASILFYARTNVLTQFLGVAITGLVLILLLVSLVLGFMFFSKEKFRAFIPTLICVIGLPVELTIAGHVGAMMEKARFEKNLPRYMEVVRLVEKGDIKPSSENYSRIHLPEQYSDLAYNVLSGTNQNGIFIEFFTGGGFPVMHSGYLYVSNGQIETDTNLLQRWPFHNRMNTNWFRISD